MFDAFEGPRSVSGWRLRTELLAIQSDGDWNPPRLHELHIRHKKRKRQVAVTEKFPYHSDIMARPRNEYKNVTTQLPDAIWAALVAEAESNGESIAKLLSSILAKRYRVPADQLPKPKRTGRRPKKER